MFGLFLRRSAWPLAIMLSADRVPVKSTRLHRRSGTCGVSRSVARRAWVRYSINALSNLVAHHHGPGDAGDLVGQGDGGDLDRTALHEPDEPGVAGVTQLLGPLDNR